MFSKLKNIKELRDQAKKMQSRFSTITAEADAAWGKVKATVNGNQEVMAITIAPELMTPAEKEKVESAVKEAVNSALKKVQREVAMDMQRTGDFNLPGLG